MAVIQIGRNVEVEIYSGDAVMKERFPTRFIK